MKPQEVNAIVNKKSQARKMEREEIRRRRLGFEKYKGHAAVHTAVLTGVMVACRAIFYING